MERIKKFFVRNTKKIMMTAVLALPVLFILNIYFSVPSQIILSEESEYTLKVGKFCSAEERIPARETASGGKAFSREFSGGLSLNTQSQGRYSVTVRFLKIPLKTVQVTVTPKNYVIPCGEPIGVKMYTDGLLVVRISDVKAEDGSVCTPAKKAGVRKGDQILGINDTSVRTGEEFTKRLNEIRSELNLTVKRGEEILTIPVTPVQSAEDHRYKLGIWVRDSAAGIGTLTFYNPETQSFAALGHAITDADTGQIMPIRKGNILTCRILSIHKGERGVPGEIIGTFSDRYLGTISRNSELGIYGTFANPSGFSFPESVEVATRYQIREDAAEVLANIDGNGAKYYQAQILRVSKDEKVDNKGLVVQITDPELLEKTGGIVQGMSGAPILQNHMLIGAVTHVFVNDPTKGYGIFAETMLSKSQE